MIRSKLLLLIILAGLFLSACGDSEISPGVTLTTGAISKTSFATVSPSKLVTSPTTGQTPSFTVPQTTAVSNTVGDPIPIQYAYVGETEDGGSNWGLLMNVTERDSKETTNSYKLDCVSQKTCINLENFTDTTRAKYFTVIREGTQKWKNFPTSNNNSTYSCLSLTKCWRLFNNGSSGEVGVTDDGGKTWSNLTTTGSLKVNAANNPTYLKVRRNDDIRSELAFTHTISCVNADRCLLVGQGRSIRTVDGGKTWDWFFTDNLFNKQTICFDDNNCYSVSRTAITYTKNFGETWQKFSLPVKVENLSAMSCSSINFCVAGGEEGYFLVTKDGGTTWAKRSVLEQESLSDVSCPDEVTCYAIIAKATLLVTRDAGKTWAGRPIVLENFDGNFTNISCPTTTNCLIAYRHLDYS